MVIEKVLNVKFGKLVDSLYQGKLLNSSQADNDNCQYNDLLQSVCIKHQEGFSSFDYRSDRVDKFLGKFIEKCCSNLWTVYIFVFL